MSRELTKDFRTNAIDVMRGALPPGAILELNAAFAAAAPSGDEARKALSRAQAEHARALDDKTLNQERAVDMGALREDAISRIAHGAGMIGKARQDALEKRKAGGRTTMDMIIILNARIAALNAEIEALNRQIDDMLREIFTEDEIEALSALPEDRQAEAIRSALADRLDAGEVTGSQRDALTRAISEREQRRAELEQAEEAVAEIHERADREYPAYAQDDGASGLAGTYENRIEMASTNTLADNTVAVEESRQMRSDMRSTEIEILTLEELLTYSEHPDWVRQIDEFLDSADEATKASLLADPTTDERILERLKLDMFRSLHERISPLRGTENYERALNGIIDRVDAATHALLIEDEDTPEDVLTALIHRIDAPSQDAGPQHLAQQPVETPSGEGMATAFNREAEGQTADTPKAAPQDRVLANSTPLQRNQFNTV